MIWTAGPDFHHSPITPHLFQPNASIFSAISLLTPRLTHTHAHTPAVRGLSTVGLFPKAGKPSSPIAEHIICFLLHFLPCEMVSGFLPGSYCSRTWSMHLSGLFIVQLLCYLHCSDGNRLFSFLLLPSLFSSSSSSHFAPFSCEIPVRCSR